MRRRKMLLFSTIICSSLALIPDGLETSYSPEHLQLLESRLLQMFGLSRVPTPEDQHRSSIPKVLQEMYHYQNGDESESHFEVHESASSLANIIRHHEESSSTELGSNQHLLQYNFQLPAHEELHHTELVLHTHKPTNNTNFKVYLVTNSDNKILLDEKLVSGESIERFDLTQAARVWRGNENNNFGIVLEIENGDSSHVRMRRSSNSQHNDAPVLLSYTHDGSASPVLRRSRRKTKDHRKKSHLTPSRHQPCSRQKLYVDFKTLSWHKWIVAPVGYESYYCDGKCDFPLDQHLNSTNHGRFNAYLNMLDHTVTDGACCVPTDLKPLHLLYLDEDDRAALRAYEDMVVDACGCR